MIDGLKSDIVSSVNGLMDNFETQPPNPKRPRSSLPKRTIFHTSGRSPSVRVSGNSYFILLYILMFCVFL